MDVSIQKKFRRIEYYIIYNFRYFTFEQMRYENKMGIVPLSKHKIHFGLGGELSS